MELLNFLLVLTPLCTYRGKLAAVGGSVNEKDVKWRLERFAAEI